MAQPAKLSELALTEPSSFLSEPVTKLQKSQLSELALKPPVD